MAKRYTDSCKWNKSWYMELSIKGKLLWTYICDTCDHAGIWEKNLKLASFQIGLEITEEDLKDLEKNLLPLQDNKFFVPRFVEFQYGKLDETNRVHASVIKILTKYGIYPQKQDPSMTLVRPMHDPSMTLARPIDDPKDKDKDKDKVKDKEKEKDKLEGGVGETLNPEPPVTLFPNQRQSKPPDETLPTPEQVKQYVSNVIKNIGGFR